LEESLFNGNNGVKQYMPPAMHELFGHASKEATLDVKMEPAVAKLDKVSNDINDLSQPENFLSPVK